MEVGVSLLMLIRSGGIKEQTTLAAISQARSLSILEQWHALEGRIQIVNRGEIAGMAHLGK